MKNKAFTSFVSASVIRGILRGVRRRAQITPDEEGWLVRPGRPVRVRRGRFSSAPLRGITPAPERVAHRTCRSKTKGKHLKSLMHRDETPLDCYPIGWTIPQPALQVVTEDVVTRAKRNLQDALRLVKQMKNFPVLTVELGSLRLQRRRVLLLARIVFSLEGRTPSGGADEEVAASSCQFSSELSKLARSAVILLEDDLGISRLGNRKIPSKVPCGTLRSTVRSMFQDHLPEVVELSIKTAQKLEHRVCSFCETRFESYVKNWTENRFTPVSVNTGHLALFRRAFRKNVKKGWNLRQYPYVPNGHATLSSTRREGGNWNEEAFHSWCRPELVISSGKPRVVTLYSEYNTRVLTPLHTSLYEGLCKEAGWVLRGSPKSSHVQRLNGHGPLISLDYRGATDSFKTAYVRAAVEILQEQAVGLTQDEIDCLRVLGELRISPSGPVATRGQPMGSVMSFPLLCLFNKTVQDLALEDLLLQGSITFKEWTCHRTLINGDDSLTREPRANEQLLLPRIEHHGSMVGMEVNLEKSMVDAEKGEINSTLFRSGQLQKKTNLAALEMRPEVNDVLGFAAESTRTLRGFLRVVLRNRRILAKQDDKRLGALHLARYRRAIWWEPRIAECLTASPRDKRPVKSGRLAMKVRPDGYFLPREVEVELINSEVAAIRRFEWRPSKDRFRTVACYGTHIPSRRVLPSTLDLLPAVLVDEYTRQQREELVRQEPAIEETSDSIVEIETAADSVVCSGNRPMLANVLIGMIKSGRKQKKLSDDPHHLRVSANDFGRSDHVNFIGV